MPGGRCGGERERSEAHREAEERGIAEKDAVEPYISKLDMGKRRDDEHRKSKTMSCRKSQDPARMSGMKTRLDTLRGAASRKLDGRNGR